MLGLFSSVFPLNWALNWDTALGSQGPAQQSCLQTWEVGPAWPSAASSPAEGSPRRTAKTHIIHRYSSFLLVVVCLFSLNKLLKCLKTLHWDHSTQCLLWDRGSFSLQLPLYWMLKTGGGGKKAPATSLASSNSAYLTLAPALACCDNHTIEGRFPVKI